MTPNREEFEIFFTTCKPTSGETLSKLERKFPIYSSKYRMVYADQQPSRTKLWEGFTLSKSAWDANWITVNNRWIALTTASGMGSTVAILDASKPGPVQEDYLPLIKHRACVLNLEFSPFGESLLATCGEDTLAKLWRIPCNLPYGTPAHVITTPVQQFSGHKRKVGIVKFHPTVEDIIVTASSDYTVRIWDEESGKWLREIAGHHENIIQSVDWNYDGSLLATHSKDKALRLFDPRQQALVSSIESHQGVKGGRAFWCGKGDILGSVGFTRTEREIRLVDSRKMDSPLHVKSLDSAAGMIMPFYDEDSDILFLSGKVREFFPKFF
jgi:coronin-1B/1C/6